MIFPYVCKETGCGHSITSRAVEEDHYSKNHETAWTEILERRERGRGRASVKVADRKNTIKTEKKKTEIIQKYQNTGFHIIETWWDALDESGNNRYKAATSSLQQGTEREKALNRQRSNFGYAARQLKWPPYKKFSE
ncbi:hypothetical protein T439DRAFT_154534 [Meredithblackwellia eburnea MCA 4105]